MGARLWRHGWVSLRLVAAAVLFFMPAMARAQQQGSAPPPATVDPRMPPGIHVAGSWASTQPLELSDHNRRRGSWGSPLPQALLIRPHELPTNGAAGIDRGVHVEVVAGRVVEDVPGRLSQPTPLRTCCSDRSSSSMPVRSGPPCPMAVKGSPTTTGVFVPAGRVMNVRAGQRRVRRKAGVVHDEVVGCAGNRYWRRRA